MDTITIKDISYNLAFLVSVKYLPSKRAGTKQATHGEDDGERVPTGEVRSSSSLTLHFVGLTAPVHAHGDEADEFYEQLAQLMDVAPGSPPPPKPL